MVEPAAPQVGKGEVGGIGVGGAGLGELEARLEVEWRAIGLGGAGLSQPHFSRSLSQPSSSLITSPRARGAVN